MANKKKLGPASIQANKLVAELLAKRKKIAAQVQFRKEILDSQKHVNYQHEVDRLQGAKPTSALHPNVKSRMKHIQHKATQSLKGETLAIYNTKF